MKKRIFLTALAALLSLLLLTACDTAPNGDEPSTAETEAETTFDYTGMTLLGDASLTAEELGIRVHSWSSTDYAVAKIEPKHKNVQISAYSKGEATVSVADCFGHTASFTVKVGEDNSVSVTPTPCTESFIEVSAYGAKGDGKTDDSEAFQKAINAAPSGGTVYVYPGTYKLSVVQMKAGVTLKMYSGVKDARQGFTDELEQALDNSKLTVLKGVHFMNNITHASASGGCSDFTVSGGVLDMTGSSAGAIVLSGAENVRIENVIFKDAKKSPAVRLLKCKNTTVENCLFVGFTADVTYSQELLLIESPVAGDGVSVTVEGCYFGKSDETGAPKIAIGHRFMAGQTAGADYEIRNCTFEGCGQALVSYSGLAPVSSGNKMLP